MGIRKPVYGSILLLLAVFTHGRSLFKESPPRELSSLRRIPARKESVPIRLNEASVMPLPKQLAVGERLVDLTIPVDDPDAQRFLPTSNRLATGIISCPCSPSGRGAALNVTTNVQTSLRTLTKRVDSELNVSDPGTAAVASHEIGVQIALNSISLYGYEAFVNADSQLRKVERLTFCAHDLASQKNVFFFKGSPGREAVFLTVGKCDTAGNYKSKARFLSRKGSQPVPTPTQAPENPSSLPPGDSTTPRGRSRNEGCVAVEHLEGFVLQHRTHLLRSVLCSSGFCATPNHGIIVDGVYTSMKQLCFEGSWKCFRQIKWVNNLKVAANRRAVVSDSIIITPYDVRFPKAAIWVVQISEDALGLVASSLVIGSVAAVTFLLLPVFSDVV